MDNLQNSDGGGANGGGRLNGNPLEGLGNPEVQQFLDGLQSTLRSSGFDEQAVEEIMQAMQLASQYYGLAMQVLAKYDIMGLGRGLGLRMTAVATVRTDSTHQQVPASQAPAGPSMVPGNSPIQQITQDNQPFGGGEPRDQGELFMASQAVEPFFVPERARALIPARNGTLSGPGGSNNLTAFSKTAASVQKDPVGIGSRGPVDNALDSGCQWDGLSESSTSMIGQSLWNSSDSREQRSSLGGGGAGRPQEGASGREQSFHGTERNIWESVMLKTGGYPRKHEFDAAKMNIPLQAAQLLGEFEATMNEEEQPAEDFDSGEDLNPQESQPNGKESMAVEENQAGAGDKFYLLDTVTVPECSGGKTFSEFSVAVEPVKIKNRPAQKSLTRQNPTDHPESRKCTATKADTSNKLQELAKKNLAAKRESASLLKSAATAIARAKKSAGSSCKICVDAGADAICWPANKRKPHSLSHMAPIWGCSECDRVQTRSQDIKRHIKIAHHKAKKAEPKMIISEEEFESLSSTLLDMCFGNSPVDFRLPGVKKNQRVGKRQTEYSPKDKPFMKVRKKPAPTEKWNHKIRNPTEWPAKKSHLYAACDLCDRVLKLWKNRRHRIPWTGMAKHALTHMKNYWYCSQCRNSYQRKDNAINHAFKFHKKEKYARCSVDELKYQTIVRQTVLKCWLGVLKENPGETRSSNFKGMVVCGQGDICTPREDRDLLKQLEAGEKVNSDKDSVEGEESRDGDTMETDESNSELGYSMNGEVEENSEFEDQKPMGY